MVLQTRSLYPTLPHLRGMQAWCLESRYSGGILTVSGTQSRLSNFAHGVRVSCCKDRSVPFWHCRQDVDWVWLGDIGCIVLFTCEASPNMLKPDTSQSIYGSSYVFNCICISNFSFIISYMCTSMYICIF